MAVANPAEVKNPDDLWLHPGARSFYYVPKSNHLTIGNAWYERHQDLMQDDDHLKSQFPNVDGPSNVNTQHLALQGRIGYIDGQQLVSFWNPNQHARDIPSALKRLQEDGHLRPDALLVGKGFPKPKAVGEVTGIRDDLTGGGEPKGPLHPWQQQEQEPEMPQEPEMQPEPEQVPPSPPPPDESQWEPQPYSFSKWLQSRST